MKTKEEKQIDKFKRIILAKEAAVRELKAMVRERDETIAILYERIQEKNN
jgi:hypothetical protein